MEDIDVYAYVSRGRQLSRIRTRARYPAQALGNMEEEFMKVP